MHNIIITPLFYDLSELFIGRWLKYWGSGRMDFVSPGSGADENNEGNVFKTYSLN